MWWDGKGGLLEWAESWQPDYFAKPRYVPPSQRKKSPGFAGALKGQRLLTQADLNDWYRSEMLGQLQKGGFIFKQDLSHGWGALDEDDLAVLETIARSKMALMTIQKERSEQPVRPIQSAAKEKEISQAAKTENAWYVAQGRKIDLSKMPWLRPVD